MEYRLLDADAHAAHATGRGGIILDLSMKIVGAMSFLFGLVADESPAPVREPGLEVAAQEC
jgi:hypothetical protein